MRLNLKTGILTLVAAISLVACSESYPGLLYDESGSKATNTEGLDSANLVPLYVYVNKQSFFTVTATPGNGQLPSGVTRGIGSFQPITSPTDEKGNPIVYTEEDSLRYYQTNFRLFAIRMSAITSLPMSPTTWRHHPLRFTAPATASIMMSPSTARRT